MNQYEMNRFNQSRIHDVALAERRAYRDDVSRTKAISQAVRMNRAAAPGTLTNGQYVAVEDRVLGGYHVVLRLHVTPPEPEGPGPLLDNFRREHGLPPYERR